MEDGSIQKKHRKTLAVILAALFVLLLFSFFFIVQSFFSLNTSVEYERSVFVSQIAEQMKNKIVSSRESHVASIHSIANVLYHTRPKTFEQLCTLLPQYTNGSTVNRLFFLSSDGNLYGIDGTKQWVSLAYDEDILNILSDEYTAKFIRIGMTQEFMIFPAPFQSPINIGGLEMSVLLYGWDSSEYRAALSTRLFEEKSSALLVSTDGSIAVYPETEGDEVENAETYGYNIFSYLSNQGMTEDNLSTVRDLIISTDDETVLCDVAGSRWLFSVAYYSEQYRIFIMLPIQNTSSGTYRNLYKLIAGVVASLLILITIAGTIILAAAIRQKNQREKELQTELLMKTAHAKNDFLAKMSHDIRTPLNGIMGMSYIAAQKLPQECTEVSDCLDKVAVSARYLLGILNDILDMSKIESGELKLSFNPFSMETLVSEVESLVLFQMGEKDINFIIDAPEPSGYDYLCDELRLKQILINLLSNAVKFTDHGNVTLTIRTAPVAKDFDKVTFCVRDTGRGMSEEFMEYLFTPFAQEDSTIAASYGGSGLGLSIVKSFVDMMSGTISVSSKLGEGSEFTITLTLKKVEHAKSTDSLPADAKTSFRPAGKRILLCEDNDLNAEIVEIILGDFDIAVDRAENGKAGVEMFEHSEPGFYAMILMDVRMPLMDGYEATHIIRSLNHPDAGQIPICALSANAFSEDIKQSMSAGMNEHLAKPLDVAQLTRVLKKYLEE